MTDAPPTLKVLVVDDHDVVRLGVRHLLGERAQVAEAPGLREAMDWLSRETCDLLLLDLGLGDEFGLAGLPRLREADPRMKIVVLTSMPEDLYADRALSAGADGYVMKTALGEQLLEAVDQVLAGQVYVSPAIRSLLLRRLAGGAADGRPQLSARELEVLRLVAAGRSTREIAEQLNRSVKTIETHKQSLKGKLGAASPAQLVRLAVGWFGGGRLIAGGLRRAGLKSAVLLALLLAGLPAAPQAADPAMHLHLTERGDTLIGLGRRFLVDPARWPEIARANRLRNPDRIATGVMLRIPLDLMRTEAVPATVLRTVGEVAQSSAAPLGPGQPVPEGSELRTGADGHLTLRLVDGTLLRLRPGSRLQIDESRRVQGTTAVRSGARLDQGRIEVEAAPAPAGRPGFRIGTPQGVLGVRGTEFRVAAGDGLTHGEVLGGVVAVDGRAGTPGQRVEAGFGTRVDAAGLVEAPVPLLARPEVSALPVLQERILLRFAPPPLAGSVAWRGQIASDEAFEQVLADQKVSGAELRFADLPDGDYVLRLRGIDVRGLEGRDADHRFRLKARPEPPLPSAPGPDETLFGDQVRFAWAANPEAQSYRLQLSTDERFDAPLRELRDLSQLAALIEGLAPGRYYWRLSSVRRTPQGAADPGPWGVLRSFVLRPPPPQPVPPAVGDDSVRFSGEGGPGQTYDFELARDAGFTDLVLVRRLDEPEIVLPLPGSGRFYLRLRIREADGFVGPYTAPQHFDLPNCVRDGSGGCVRAGGDTLNLER